MTAYDTSWEKVFKDGFAPQLTDADLLALATACVTFDPRLIQGTTCRPDPLVGADDTPAECGCLVAFVGMTQYGRRTSGRVLDWFHDTCYAADVALGEPLACRYLLNWWDDAPPLEVRRTVYGWCRELLAARGRPELVPSAPFPARLPPYLLPADVSTGPAPF